MRRILLWLLISACLWEGFVYLYSRPLFWVGLARVGERICTGALRMYDMSNADLAHRTRGIGSMHTGDTVTDIEEYLKRERSP